jgi:ligand-binding sensor domain-containing protein/signal transduction histidine kinase
VIAIAINFEEETLHKQSLQRTNKLNTLLQRIRSTNLGASNAETLFVYRKARYVLVGFTLLILLLFSVQPIRAQYRFDTYSTDDGLPQNSVHSIVQTRDGYLWFTTFDGLIRYDGVRFAIFDKASTKGLVSNRFSSLFQASDGALWAGTQDGGVTRYKNGSFITYTTDDGLPDNSIVTICDDGAGGPLVWTREGVVFWRDGHFVSDALLGTYSHYAVAQRDSSGALWFYSMGGLRRLKNGQISTFTPEDGLVPSAVSCIYEDPHARIWVGTASGKLFLFENERFQEFAISGQLPPFAIWAMREDRLGNLWLATRGGGLVRINGDRLTLFNKTNGLGSDAIVSLYEDREGSLWVGTDNHGVALVRREAVQFLSPADGLSGSNVYPILEDKEGAVWIGTWDGGLSRYQNGHFSSLFNQPGFPKSLITALRQDREGRIWVGLYGGVGRIERGTFTNLTKELGLEFQPVFVIYEDRSGVLWLGTRVGLYRYAGGEMKHYTTADGLAGNDVKDILEDRNGDFWIATYGGLSRWRNGQIESSTVKDGLASNYVRTLYEDGNGTLWVGTYDGGLSRYRDGKFVNYTTADGLFSNGVFRILDDGAGNFWMSCNRGIFRVSREQLESFAAGKVRRITSVPFGKDEGLVSTECNGGQQPAGIKTRDGRLWYPTQGGVAMIDPHEVTTNSYAPPVVIEEALLDRSPLALGSNLQIGPSQSNLEIHYTGLSFINAQHVVFRYRMEGLDPDWIEAGTRRTVQYAHLPPGNYTFTVIAGNADGVWNTTGARLQITVVPPFWRTWWFSILAGVVLVGFAYAFYRFQLTRLRKAHATQRAFSQQLIELQEGERKRIAAGLHDSLGQNLLIIKNRALLGLQTPGENGAAHIQLEEISNVSSQALDEVREIAYDLHPYQMDRLGLTKALKAMLRKVAAASDIELSMDIDNIDGLLPTDSEINIYRIVQESINNILKHSHARTAQVAIKREPNSVQISVIDDGRGFSPNAAPPARTGFGLLGISERARMLGGKYSIQSTPGAGAKVIVKLELPEISR